MPGSSRGATSSRGRKVHFESERFDPALWCVVRAGDEIAAGTISRGDTYGGGFVDVLFTRRPWRRQGVGAALLADAFARFWERDEYNVGLTADAASDTGAFRIYERAGMAPCLVGWCTRRGSATLREPRGGAVGGSTGAASRDSSSAARAKREPLMVSSSPPSRVRQSG